jgi:Caspase domain
MSNGDPALVYLDDALPPANPGTHVLIIGVGGYQFGKGPQASLVAGDLNQLTSPPVSARAIADWFIESFRNPNKPLASVSLLLSEAAARTYQPPRPVSSAPKTVPNATLDNVKAAALKWAERLKTNKDNLAVFYFCGHGASQGPKAALLLEDFGRAGGTDFDAAVDVEVLQGTMLNSPAIQQLYLLDCCRTAADDLYRNEPRIGSRIVSNPALDRKHTAPSQQFVLFPTLDGEAAFGAKNAVSIFTRSIIDALSFAAADDASGPWRTTTGKILDAVDLLVKHRVPPQLTTRPKPNAVNATSFDFNHIDPPVLTRSLVTVADLGLWGSVELECTDLSGVQGPFTEHSRNMQEPFVDFSLPEGRWRFAGTLPTIPPRLQAEDRTVRVPVVYVTLQNAP